MISIESVTDNDDLMIINKSGLIIRLAVGELRVMGRATQGVRLINLRDNDAIAAVTKVEMDQAEVVEDEETDINIISDEISDNTDIIDPEQDNTNKPSGDDESESKDEEDGTEIV